MSVLYNINKKCKCSICGIEHTIDKIYYYVDCNNRAITKNSKPYCYNCYIKTYGKKG